jgi:hypothetical protein
MRIWTGTLCIFMLLQLADAAPQDQTTKASIEGVITRADNGEPIGGAQLMVNKLATFATGIAGGVVGGSITSVLVAPPPGVTNPIAPPTQIAPVTTDSNGRFQIKELEPGTYRVIATATGFVRQEYGQRSIAAGLGNGTLIELTAGQSFKIAAIRLTATGIVSGRIFDDTGQPAVGVPVLVLQYTYDPTGLKTLRQTATGNADDRGTYRVYGITPGRYYIGVGNGPGPSQGGLRGAGGQSPSTSYAFSYYPGVDDVNQANLVEVQPGGEAVADMRVVRQKLYSVRGRVVDATGQMVQNAGLQQGQSPVNVSLTYSRFGGSGSFSSGRSYDPSTGKFELLNVIPGSYVIQAQLQTTGLGPVTSPAEIQDRLAVQASRPIAELPIDVQNADMENLVLTFMTPVSAPGKLTVEGQQLSDVPGYDRFRLQIRKMVNESLNNIGTPPQQQAFGADGTFQVAGLRTGKYQVNFLGFPPTVYVKSLQFDGKDILGKLWEFSGATGSGFSIVLSSKPGQVSGTLTDSKMQPLPGVQVVIIPNDKRERSDLYRSNVTDKNGRFTIGGITPGNYKVFAWDGMEPFRYFDAEFLKTYETKGRSIVVGESASVTADIQVIPITEP